MDNEYLSSDFSYRKYSLEQLDNWLHDAMNCEDLTPQDIYETIVKCVDGSIEYHKTHLTRNIELLSLLKGHRPVDFLENMETTPFSEASEKDWEDFWKEQTEISEHYSEEDLNAMCDAAEEKKKCREYNLREAEYYNKRAQLDAEFIKKQGGYDWTPGI